MPFKFYRSNNLTVGQTILISAIRFENVRKTSLSRCWNKSRNVTCSKNGVKNSLSVLVQSALGWGCDNDAVSTLKTFLSCFTIGLCRNPIEKSALLHQALGKGKGQLDRTAIDLINEEYHSLWPWLSDWNASAMTGHHSLAWSTMGSLSPKWPTWPIHQSSLTAMIRS